MRKEPSNNNSIRLAGVFYGEDGPSFQHIIEELFKAYAKSRFGSSGEGEPDP